MAARVGYPVLVRPSYVLGGRAMEIVYDDASLRNYFARAARVAPGASGSDRQLPGRRLRGRCRRHRRRQPVVIGGVMQHIEDAGIHSGDSACVLHRISSPRPRWRRCGGTRAPLPSGWGWSGLLNVQFAIKHDVVYVLEVNPRGSRTVPFVSKTTACRSPVWPRR